MQSLPPSQPFTVHHARALGWTSNQLTKLTRAGALRRILAGVYVGSDVPDSLALRAAAASLVVPAHTVMCDRTAAWVHGVDALAFWELALVPPIETVVLPESTRVRRVGALGGRRDLSPDDIVEVDGLLVTSPRRTIIDLGCKLRKRDAVAAADWLMRTHGVTRTELIEELPRFRGRRGVVQARTVVDLADPRSESPGESWMRVCIVEAGLPAPEPQVWVYDGDVPVYRLDLGYSRLLIGGEFDGADFHGSAEQRRQDVRRRGWLADQGWALVVVRKEDFTRDRVQAWTRQLSELLDERRRVRGNVAVRRWRSDLAGVGRRGPTAP